MLRLLVPQLDSRVELVVRDDSDNDFSQKLFEDIALDKTFSTQYYKGKKIGLDAANLFCLKKLKETLFGGLVTMTFC